MTWDIFDRAKELSFISILFERLEDQIGKFLIFKSGACLDF